MFCDGQSQLTRENNQAAGKTWVYAYDAGGNIQSKTEYAYTTGTLGTVVDTVNYTYGNEAWKDLLTGYDGKTVTSDGIGNMLSDGTWTYTWRHGRQLASASNGTTNVSYTYDIDGLRTGKTVGSTATKYYYLGTQLTDMTVGSVAMHFTYDELGPESVSYNGSTYYYVKNAQGDVIAIVNSSGAVVVEYTYDAWGKLLSTTGSMASTLGAHNPLRYRGYVYDTETGLYYLQTRYYDPDMGRWINADGQINTSLKSIGCNMFAYCVNNPVVKVDTGGNRPGALFDSIDDAAIDFSRYIYDYTIRNNVEYATKIIQVEVTVKNKVKVKRQILFLNITVSRTVKTKVVKYTYKSVRAGSDVSVTPPVAPRKKVAVAYAHTHAAANSEYHDELFSDYYGDDGKPAGDIPFAKDKGVPLYLLTPSGVLKCYDPLSESQRDITWDLNS